MAETSRARLAELWVHRGAAWDALATVERELLNAQRIAPGDPALLRRLRDAIGCLFGVQELLALATARIEQLASELPASPPKPETPGTGER